MKRNPIEEISPEMARAIRNEGFRTWCETRGKSSPDWTLVGTQDIVRRMVDVPHLGEEVYRVYVWKGYSGGEACVQWAMLRPSQEKFTTSRLDNSTMILGAGFLTIEEGQYGMYVGEKNAFVCKHLRGQGVYRFVLHTLRKLLRMPIHSDVMRSAACEGAWARLSDETDRVKRAGMIWKYNPAPHVPVMGYGAAHRWEALAKAKGVSAVARSPRGFMRAYEKAGTWARLDPWWKNRRNAFVARHMAQVRQNGEKLWKKDKSGKLQPSRRCLALLMWAYMPRKS
jgi:hypothetical protein